MPALLTRTSTWPNSASVASCARSTWSKAATSTGIALMRPLRGHLRLHPSRRRARFPSGMRRSPSRNDYRSMATAIVPAGATAGGQASGSASWMERRPARGATWRRRRRHWRSRYRYTFYRARAGADTLNTPILRDWRAQWLLGMAFPSKSGGNDGGEGGTLLQIIPGPNLPAISLRAATPLVRVVVQ